MKTGKRRRGVARPSKLTPDVSKRIENALRLGNFRKTAALYGGISYRAFLEWMAAGKERPTSEYGKFRAMVIEIETGAEVTVAGVLLNAATVNPKFAIEWLRLRHRKRWDPADRLELTGNEGGPLQIVVQSYADEPEGEQT